MKNHKQTKYTLLQYYRDVEGYYVLSFEFGPVISRWIPDNDPDYPEIYDPGVAHRWFFYTWFHWPPIKIIFSDRTKNSRTKRNK